ncbi:2091_t:CDS:1, partial [Gigaspora rosea]
MQMFNHNQLHWTIIDESSSIVSQNQKKNNRPSLSVPVIKVPFPLQKNNYKTKEGKVQDSHKITECVSDLQNANELHDRN